MVRRKVYCEVDRGSLPTLTNRQWIRFVSTSPVVDLLAIVISAAERPLMNQILGSGRWSGPLVGEAHQTMRYVKMLTDAGLKDSPPEVMSSSVGETLPGESNVLCS